MTQSIEKIIHFFELEKENRKFTLQVCPDVPSFIRSSGKSGGYI